MPYEVTLEDRDPTLTAAIRYRVPMDTIPQIVPEAFGRLFAHVGRSGGRPTGEVLCLYNAWDQDGVDMEVAIGVATPVPEEPGDAVEGRVVMSALPAGKVAHTTHRGPYDLIGAAYEAVTGWIQENGRETAGPMWEIYRNGPDEVSDPSELVTDIYVPVR